MSKFAWIRRLVRLFGVQASRKTRAQFQAEALEERITPAIAIGDFNGDRIPDFARSSTHSTVQLFSGESGTQFAEFETFADWKNATVTLASGDFDGDGAADLAIGAGSGGGSRVRVLGGKNGTVLFDQFVFEPQFHGGVHIAAGDVNGDGRAELFVGAGKGGAPRVRILDLNSGSSLQDFFVYEEHFRGGAQVAAGDVNGDGRADLMTGAGVLGGPRVRSIDGLTGATLRDQFAGDPTRRDGITIGQGDVDGNGRANLVAFADGQLNVFAGTNPNPFVRFPMMSTSSIHSGDLNGDGFEELLIDDGTTVRGYDGITLTPNGWSWVAGASGAFATARPADAPSRFDGEAIRVPGSTGETTLRIDRLRQYSAAPAEIGVFRVDTTAGAIGANLPGDVGYLAAALDLSRRIVTINQGESSGLATVSAGELFGLYMKTAAGTVTSFAASHPGQDSRILRLADNRFAIQETPQGGFEEFNAVIGRVIVGDATVPPPPGDGNFPPDLTGYTPTNLGGTTGGTTVTNGVAMLREGDRFRVGLSREFTAPSEPTAIQVSFEAPSFDAASDGLIRDAFEIAVLGEDDSPLALPTAEGRDAALNWTEGFTATGGPATTLISGVATLNLSAIPAGTKAQLVVRLVNNDADTETSVRISRVDFVAASGSAPTGVPANGLPEVQGAIDLQSLVDVTPSIGVVYGRTTLTEENTILTTDLALRNDGIYAVSGEAVAVIGNLSDPTVAVLNPDGFTPDGRPYFRFLLSSGLTSGESTLSRLIRFTNPGRERFTYDVQVLAGLNRAPVLSPLADAEIVAGQSFTTKAIAADPDGHALTYRLLASPVGMTIDAGGQLLFTPQAGALGTHSIRIRVTDSLGASAEGGFVLTVRSVQPNRPPIFTSTPPTDATVASPFEVYTYATGPNPVAVTAGSFGKGISVVTADPDDQSLRLHTGPGFTPDLLSVGELDPAAFKNHPLLQAAAVDLGIAPGTFNNSERDVYGFIAPDVNADGNPDLVATVVLGAASIDNADSGTGYLVVRLGNGDGTFRAGWQTQLPAVTVNSINYSSYTGAVRFVDATGDNIGDLLAVQRFGGRILVYPGQGDGTFVATPIISESNAHVVNFQVADLNNDGKTDVVRFEQNFANRFRSGTSVLFGDGTGSFANDALYTALDREDDGYLVNVDNANGPDLVRLDYDGSVLNTRLNDGTGAFGPVIASGFDRPTTAQFGDFDGDGFTDAAVGQTFQTDGGVVVYPGNGDGTFGNAKNQYLPNFQETAAYVRGGDGVAPDLNGDGKPDILFGDTGTSSVVVAISDGAGKFSGQSYVGRMIGDIGEDVAHNEADGPFVATADWNRDGVVDVMIGRYRNGASAGAIGLALGDRPGTFRLPRTVPIALADGFETSHTLMADLNNDGILDLIGHNRYNVTTSLGRGDGTFEPQQIALNHGYNDNSSMRLADFDGDGFTDLSFISGHSFVQAFGLGNGTFSYMPSVPYPGQYGYMPHGADYGVIGDFNDDDHPDLAYRLSAGETRNVFVLLYDPVQRRYNLLPDVTGLFTDQSYENSIGFADLNGDGRGELFAYNPAFAGQPTRLTVWQPQGSNATDAATLFSRTVVPATGFGDFFPQSMVVGDFDRDGHADLAIGGSDTIRVGFGKGDFTFRDVVHYYAPGIVHVDGADVNGDGLLDLIANFSRRRRSGGFPGGGVYLGRADGTFEKFREFGGSGSDLTWTFLDYVDAGDVNRDGRSDFVINLGGFSTVFYAAPPGLAAVANGDLNGDGNPDLVAVNTSYDRVKVLLGDGQNGFTRQSDLFSDFGPVDVALGDVNDDGKQDFVTANRIGRSVSLFRNTGTAFTRIDADLEMRPDRVRVADLNGDGRDDVVAVGEQTLSILPGTATGLGTALTLPLGFAAAGLLVADATGDGNADVVLTDPAGRFVILPGQGDGTFGAAKLTTLPAVPGQVAAADLNADGKQDLIVTFPELEQIGILFGRGAGRFTLPQMITVGDTPSALTVSDVNEDGKPDLLITNTGDGTLSVVLNRFDPTRLLRYEATATDPDGDPISFSLEAGPGGMLFDEATGVAVWAPMPEQIGDNAVTLRASDGRGGYAEQGFTIRVSPANGVTPPAFTSEPVTSVSADTAYRYQPRVVAKVGETLRYSLVDGPAGMTVDPMTGEVNWDGRDKGLALAINTSVTSTPAIYSGVGITVNDAPTLRTASVTAEGWFKFDQIAGFSDTLLAKRWNTDTDPSHVRSWALRIDNGFLRAFTGHINGSGGNVSAPGQLRANQWYHIALTFEDATRTLSLYLNGELVGSTISADALYYSDRPLEISPFRALAMTVSDVRVWDRARTAAELNADMHRVVPGDSPGLVLNFRFQEGFSATTVADSTVNDHVGYITNTFERYDYPGQVPALAPIGMHSVTIRVDDGKGGVRDQQFTIRVTPPFATQVSGTVFDDADGDGVRDRRTIDNLLVNGDFSSGAVGFTSELMPGTYTTNSGSQLPGAFTVGVSMLSLPGSSFEVEHTTRTGAALLATPANTDRVAWAQTVAVTPGQSYDFGFWAFRTADPARMQVRVNGENLGPDFDLATAYYHWWTRFAATWTATTAEAKIEIVLLAPTGTGAVGVALDDITFLPTTAPRAVVPGSRELWLAGTPAGTNANGDSAPASSPVQVPNLALAAGQMLTFSAAGGTHVTPTPRSFTADGSGNNVGIGAVNGLSGLVTPVRAALVGVFLDDASPVGQTPPETLNFQSGGNVTGGIDYLTLAPLVRQVFFIGDGKTADGVVQQITVPAGATRLFLGALDAGGNGDNPDGFEVRVIDAAQPELEPALANRVVYVDRDGNGRLSAGEPTATTNDAGLYSFALSGESAKIRIVPEAGRTQSHPASGFHSVDLSGDSSRIDFALAPAANGPPVFVTQPPVTLGAPQTLSYAAFATSTDGSPITYRLAVAPDGAVIDAESGLVTWAAGSGNAGPVDFILTATDGQGRVAFQQFTLIVTANTPPVITSTPRNQTSAGVLFRYDVAAQDAEQVSLTYALDASPAGMQIDPATGRLTWTPGDADIGSHDIGVVVRDTAGGEAQQTFSLLVVPASPNQAPTITSGPRPNAQVGTPYRSRITAQDPDDDALTFSALDAPAGFTVSADGLIAWTPADLGPVSIRARVSDGRGGSEEQTFVIQVGTLPVVSTLSITSIPPANAVLDQTYGYDLVAPGAAAFELLQGPAGLSLDPVRGRIRWTPAANQLGPITVAVRAYDEVGATAEQSWTITVRGSALAPSFASTPPTTAAVGNTYVYPAYANNPGGSTLTFALVAGPAGFDMNVETGVATWTPAAGQTGPQAVVLQVRDGRGNFSTQAFEIVVGAGLENQPPLPLSQPPSEATVGVPLSYTFQAMDPDGGVLAFSIVRGPTGMTIDSATGVVAWTPASDDIGIVTVTLAAHDPQGAAVVQSFLLDVLAPNRVPEIVNAPPDSVPQGGVYRYDIRAVDPDREPLFFQIVSGPAEMTIDALGRVRWQTAIDTPLGPQNVTVRAIDGRGALHERSFAVNVVPDTMAPRVVVLIHPVVIYPYSPPARVRISTSDDVGVVDLRVLLDGVLVALAADNSFSVPYSAPGNGKVQVFAKDAAGNEGKAAGRVNMRTGLENDPNNNPGDPTAALALIEGAAVGGLVTITGTATSPDLDHYTLSYRRADLDLFTTISTGTSSVTNGNLGVWDTTLLENDSYLLRLEVFDIYGGSATVERTVGVTGDFKLGNFRLSFSDMTIPVAGIPITLARTYDTLRADREGDLGYGWRLEFRNTDLRTSLPRTGLEDSGIFTAFRSGVRVNLTLPGGRREGFTFTPIIQVLPGFGGQGLVIATPRFTSDRGVTSTLSAGTGNLLVNEFGELMAPGGIPWNPASPNFSGYTLTTRDGTQYRINGAGELTTASDRNGNTITFSESGVTGSGVNIAFERDAQGRITRAIDPAGNSVLYAYDSRGDLTHVTDREGNLTRYEYLLAPAHYLDKVIDPLDRTGVRAEYGPDGRLAGVSNGTGNSQSITYDPQTQFVTSADPLGQITTIGYDAAGFVTSVVDPLGRVSSYTRDGDGRLLTSTNPLGKTSQFQYDAAGNLVRGIDPLGATLLLTYDAAGRPLTQTNPLGHTTQMEYDSSGNVVRMIGPDGAVVQMSYDARGLMTSSTDASGRMTSMAYSPEGFPVSIVTPDGRVSAMANDKLGNMTQETQSAGGVVSVRSYQYSANGNWTGGTDAHGGSSTMSYDAAGEVTKSINPLGGTTQLQYGLDGQMSGSTSPGGGTITLSFDAAGRTKSATLPGGGTVGYEYDAAGQKTATILADGTRVTSTYDAAGQTTGGTSGNLGGDTRDYDDAGRLAAIHYADGGTRYYERNLAGQITAEIDQLGNRFTYSYDAAGRMIEAVLPGGQILTAGYDGDGRRITRTDLDGGIWTYTYSPGGPLAAATGPGQRTYTFTNDAFGRTTALTDPAGHAVTYGYDAANRLTSTTTAMGFTSTADYDTLNRVTQHTDGLGRTASFTYDAEHRPLTITDSDGTTSYAYGADGRLLNVVTPRGTTAMSYDGLGRKTGMSGPDGLSVTYSPDVVGRALGVSTTSGTTTRTLTNSGVLLQVTDPNGVTQYTNDLLGRPTSIVYANGSRETRSYDALGRVLVIEYRSPADVVTARLTYTRDGFGRVAQIEELSGRRTVYAYDSASRLVSETVINGATTTTTYTYDAANNIASRNSQSYTVDADDRLTSDGTWTYTWDAAGNLVGRSKAGQTDTFTYDGRNRMTRVVRTGMITTTIDYEYDHDGLMAERREGASVRRFVWDRSGTYAQLLEERDGSNAFIRRYESNGFSVDRYRDAAGNSFFLQLDHLGSVRAVLDAAAAVVATYQYDAFGRPLGATPDGFGFTNGWTDPGLGLVFLRSRWYHPEIGRFSTRDQAAVNPADPISTANRYAYVGNDPVNRLDPSGQVESYAELQTATAVLYSLFGATFTATLNAAITQTNGSLLTSFRQAFSYLWQTGYTVAGSVGVSANAGPLTAGIGAGFEFVANSASREEAIFVYFGSTFGFTSPSAPISGSLSFGGNLLFDTPKVIDYSGYYLNLAGSINLISRVLKYTDYSNLVNIARTINISGTASFGWSPTPTFTASANSPSFGAPLSRSRELGGANTVYRHSHTIGVAVSPLSGASFALSVTFYFPLWIFTAGEDRGLIQEVLGR